MGWRGGGWSGICFPSEWAMYGPCADRAAGSCSQRCYSQDPYLSRLIPVWRSGLRGHCSNNDKGQWLGKMKINVLRVGLQFAAIYWSRDWTAFIHVSQIHTAYQLKAGYMYEYVLTGNSSKLHILKQAVCILKYHRIFSVQSVGITAMNSPDPLCSNHSDSIQSSFF